jgi:hypothetical protein
MNASDISLSAKRTGVYYPLFKRRSANVPFVQEIDRDGMISAFIPFFDAEHYNFIPSSEFAQLRLGEPSIYAFFKNSDLVEVNYNDLSRLTVEYFESGDGKNLDLFTRLCISRIAKIKDVYQSNFLDEYLRSLPINEHSKKVSKAATNRTTLRLSKIWDEIEAEDIKQNSGLNKAYFEKFSNEELFQWVYDRISNPDGVVGLYYLMTRVFIDDRLHDLVNIFSGNIDRPLNELSRREKLILTRGMEMLEFPLHENGDFMDFIGDAILDGSIFDLSDAEGPEFVLNFVLRAFDQDSIDANPIDISLDRLANGGLNRELCAALINFLVGEDLNFEYKMAKRKGYEGPEDDNDFGEMPFTTRLMYFWTFWKFLQK